MTSVRNMLFICLLIRTCRGCCCCHQKFIFHQQQLSRVYVHKTLDLTICVWRVYVYVCLSAYRLVRNARMYYVGLYKRQCPAPQYSCFFCAVSSLSIRLSTRQYDMSNTWKSLCVNSSSVERKYLLSNIEPALQDVFGWYHDSEPLLQPAWRVVLSNRPIFESPIFPIALALFCYFGSTVPFTILDLYGYRHWKWVKRIKIQPEVEVRMSLNK